MTTTKITAGTNFATNTNYAAIIAKGYTVDVTTSNKNKGTMFLVKDGIAVHTVPFSSHGKGTKAVLAKLESCYRHGSISTAMQQLLEWIDVNQVAVIPEPSDPFVARYNEAIGKFSPQALAKIHQAHKANPSLTFEQLMRIWNVEMQYLVKTADRPWALS